jgi:plastocyanin domain-containing protein
MRTAGVGAALLLALGGACGARHHTAGGGRVRVEVGREGFQPAALEVQSGQPLTIEFLRVTDETCATKVVFPAEGIVRDLPLGVPVLVAPATDRARRLEFQCGMGMWRGSLVVR